MARLSNSTRGVLSAQKVRTLSKVGFYADGGNLYLKVGPQGKSWVFRYKKIKSHMMGLGSYPDVTLSEARERAEDARKLLRDGLDPLQERARQKRAKNPHTFKEVMDDFIRANKPGWKPKHATQFENTLTTYALPKLANLPIDAIETSDVIKCLRPIWEEKNETANRVRGRIEAVLDYATAMGLRTGDNPARWKGHLSHLLPKRSAVAPVQHLEAHPYQTMHDFMVQLRAREGYSPRALEFTILTAMRVGAVVAARWDECSDNVWTIPAERMKGLSSDFKVPLSKQAQTLIAQLPRLDNSPYLFPGKPGQHLTIASPLALLKRRMEYPDLTVHGFRSTFRDWAAEQTAYPNHVQEMALAHTIDSKVERSYRRGDLYAKRARLMQEWANYLDSPIVISSVTPIGVNP